jgi:hypothetical protein
MASLLAWKDMTTPDKNVLMACCLWIIALALIRPFHAGACSCSWKGPFLAVFKEAPLVVSGRILRHHPGKSPTMDVLVLETVKGGLLDSGMVIDNESSKANAPCAIQEQGLVSAVQ